MKSVVTLEDWTRNSQLDQPEGCSRREQASDCSRSLRKLPILEVCPRFHPLSSLPPAPPYKKAYAIISFTYASFARNLDNSLWIYATCKGEGSISHSHEKIILNPCLSTYFICSIIQKSCLCHLAL